MPALAKLPSQVWPSERSQSVSLYCASGSQSRALPRTRLSSISDLMSKVRQRAGGSSGRLMTLRGSATGGALASLLATGFGAGFLVLVGFAGVLLPG